jgi:aldose 1-epimerase
MSTPSVRLYGHLPSGQPLELHTLANAVGASLEVLTYGGIVTALRVPGGQGKPCDVVLGFSRVEDYLTQSPYFGAIAGRIAGRVSGGRIDIDGKSHLLTRNDGPNHLHGGSVGLDKRVWRAEPLAQNSLRLRYHSPAGEEGYPGNLDLSVTYTLTDRNEFVFETEATTDQATPLSLTHHSYFNLGGEGSFSAANHVVQIFAETFVPVDDTLTLSGRRESVAGRPCDLRTPRLLRDVLPEIYRAHGDLYNLRPLDAAPPSQLTLAARVHEPRTGRFMEVYTDEACLQFYTASALDGKLIGKSGRPYAAHAGLCFECEGYPDGTTRPGFDDILVRPDRPQRRRTVYAFSSV